MASTEEPLVIVIMGVAGCGKSSVGLMLAEQLHCGFSDGDDFHSLENKEKMASGMPLTDIDRRPWLDRMHDAIQGWLADGHCHVLACSALKRAYRKIINGGDPRVHFVYLKVNYEVAQERLLWRKNHYMKADMLESQFATLEEPDGAEAIVVDAAMPVGELVAQIRSALATDCNRSQTC